jgi:hypothetical protein
MDENQSISSNQIQNVLGSGRLICHTQGQAKSRG